MLIDRRYCQGGEDQRDDENVVEGECLLDQEAGEIFRARLRAKRVPNPDAERKAGHDIERAHGEAFAHADEPYESVVERVRPVRSQAFAPLAQVVLTVADQTEIDYAADTVVPAGDELSIEPVEAAVVPAQNDLSLTVGMDRRGDGEVRLIYAVDLFDEGTVRGFAERFVRVLTAVITNPEQGIDESPLLTDDERDQVLRWSRGLHEVVVSETLTDFMSQEPGAVVSE